MILEGDRITILNCDLEANAVIPDLGYICPSFDSDLDGIHIFTIPGTHDIIIPPCHDFERQLLDMCDLGIRGGIEICDEDEYMMYELTDVGVSLKYGKDEIVWNNNGILLTRWCSSLDTRIQKKGK